MLIQYVRVYVSVYTIGHYMCMYINNVYVTTHNMYAITLCIVYGRHTADSLRCVYTDSLGRADAVQHHTHIHTGKVN